MNTYELSVKVNLRHSDVMRMTKALIKEKLITDYLESKAKVNKISRPVIIINDVDTEAMVGMLTPAESLTLKESKLSAATVGKRNYQQIFSIKWWLGQTQNIEAVPEPRDKDLSYVPAKNSDMFVRLRNKILGIEISPEFYDKANPILQYTLDNTLVHEYYNMAQLCRLTGYKAYNILDACKKNRAYSYGYKWRFKGDPL